MTKPVGIYIHLPFCQSKCAYCDFPSFAGREGDREAYARAVCGEITRRALITGPLPVDTVYLGGGTPSVMAPGQIRDILSTLRRAYQLLPEAEISCEANPGTLTPAFLDALLEGGANRLSLGAQSAHPAELELLGRAHTWEQAVSSVTQARAAGFANLNLDLMSGLPGQGWPLLEASLQVALSLPITHLSCYSLIIEEGTPFYARHQKGELPLPDEDSERRMYRNTVALLAEAGFPRYEISNFSLPGFECRHNLNCWRYQDYLGFGASAAGLYRGQRMKNPDSLDSYLRGDPPLVENLSIPDQRFEMLMLGLRTQAGLDLHAFQRRFGLTVKDAWPEALGRQTKAGLLLMGAGRLRLSEKGFDLMDRALLDFLPE